MTVMLNLIPQPRSLIVLACLALAACGTPQQQCERQVTRESRTLDKLIVETEENIERGFRYVYEYDRNYYGYRFCGGRSYYGSICYGGYGPDRTRREEAIDPVSEQRKLESLRSKRSELALQSCVGPAV
ncbi:MAG: hypothetical protein AAGF71_01255 [Pseudomonadota bacterium]